MVMEVHEPQLDGEPQAATLARSWDEYFLLGLSQMEFAGEVCCRGNAPVQESLRAPAGPDISISDTVDTGLNF